jgi:hypothetical protein
MARLGARRVPSLISKGMGLALYTEAGYLGDRAMEWFKGKTSIAGYQVSNWMIALGAVIIVLLIFRH